MADRIITMRALLEENLEKLGSNHDWSHITSQIGMFAYTGLDAGADGQVLAQEHSVYATKRRPHLGGRHHQRERRPPGRGYLQGQGLRGRRR